jgi:hypothetical protein
MAARPLLIAYVAKRHDQNDEGGADEYAEGHARKQHPPPQAS